jgi:hypothetical protein
MRLSACALLAAVAAVAHASDLYVVRFNAIARQNGCSSVTWHDEAILFNTTTAPVTVRILGVSQGQPAAGAPGFFVIQPGNAVALDDALGSAWASIAQLYVMHLDTPPGVRVSSRNEVYIHNDCIVLPPRPGALAQVAMPVFTALTPAGVAQVHLGTDLGELPSRTNVGIYNASAVVAQAHIELRRVCDGSIVDQRTVSVPANSTIQVGGLTPGANICTTSSQSEWLRYAVVTVDQPSLSFASNVRETLPNTYMGVIPTVDLGMSLGTQY